MNVNDPKVFEVEASPICWYEVAKDLDEQACLLQRERSGTTIFANSRGAVVETYTGNRGTFLLAGFAIENLLKAYLVYENPELIANGRLAKPLKSHKLTKLRDIAMNVPYKSRYSWVLTAFEEGLESWARYPCGVTMHSEALEKAMTAKLWKGYQSFFSAHRLRMKKLLIRPWRGPSGEQYRAKFTGIA